MGLADCGKPTGEFETVEKTNEDDALVKWDDDGRTRQHQPLLKKVEQPVPITKARSDDPYLGTPNSTIVPDLLSDWSIVNNSGRNVRPDCQPELVQSPVLSCRGLVLS